MHFTDLHSLSLPLLRRWFSIQNSQLVYQKKLKVSKGSSDVLSEVLFSVFS